MKQIIVKINRSERRDKYHAGYQKGDPLEAVLTIEVFNAGLTSPDDPDEVLLEATFKALNAPFFVPVGNLTPADVEDYHSKYPSLSVGDVVEINRQPYACQNMGWEKLERDSEWVWFDATDVAKIARKILKENYPDVKFSVRTRKYAGGASIDVDWWDGPLQKEVDALVKHLQSARHMDISDYVHHKRSIHDGTAFSSGANYIFPKRKHSKAFIEFCAKAVIERNRLEPLFPDPLEYAENFWSGAHLSDDAAGTYFEMHGQEVNLFQLVQQEAFVTVAKGARDFQFYEDEPETFEWTDDEGNRVTSVYHRGQVKSKWDGGKVTDKTSYREWNLFKARQGARELTNA
jgi:hypothetical protein